jgi:DNA-directed RNA polymerase subunit L
MMTGVETIAFRADMTKTGTTTDVVVLRNDTPMTNEMLADRIGLLPIDVKEPLKWKKEDYQFILKVSGTKDAIRYVKAGDFKVKVRKASNISGGANGDSNENESDENASLNESASDFGDEKENVNLPSTIESEENTEYHSASDFFPPHPITGDTCLIATLQPGSGASQQSIEIMAQASRGIGREHARFCPTSQCSYIYTPDPDENRRRELFQTWLSITKKVTEIDENSARYKALLREFNTMEVNRCYKIDENGEPYSFDFTVESAGVLSVPYIVERACEVGENMCSRYVNVDQADLPSEVTVRTSDSQVIGFDFTFQKQDHTLGNLLQTWIEQNLIDRQDSSITYVGYTIPHPLRDEMLLRIGVSDGEKKSALRALAEAAKGCVELFRALRNSWRKAIGKSAIGSDASIKRVVRPASQSGPRMSRVGMRSSAKAAAPSAASLQPLKVTLLKTE